jgi:hypothetical protein
MSSLDERRKTLHNEQSEILDARVIANYGDPGLDEDYHFDILSRYVIVKIESIDRVLTKDKWFRLLAVVKRPQHLWIGAEGGLTSPATQKRSDAYGNINTGLSSSYSVNAIARINQSYALGELIKIRKLPKTLNYANDTIFQSIFTVWNGSTWTYGQWHTDGSTLPYFAGHADRIAGLTQKTVEPIATNSPTYNFYLSKYQYEAGLLTANIGDVDKTQILTQIFEGSFGGSTKVYSANGGYLFQNQIYTLLSVVDYEDVNYGNKQRIPTNECVPLVVATPNSFPTPKSRTAGTISYNPSYATIVRPN